MGKVSLCVKKNHRFVDYPLLSFVTPLCRVRRLCGLVLPAALWRWCCWLPLSALLEFVMSSFDISALFLIAFFFLVVGALCSSVVVLLLSLTCSGLAWYGVCTTILRR